MRTVPLRLGDTAAASGSTASSRTEALGPAVREHSVLESRYPGLVRTLTLLWGHPELTDFLARVAAGLEPRVRDLDPAAMAELMLLGTLHRAICPHAARATPDVHSIGRLSGTWRPAICRG